VNYAYRYCNRHSVWHIVERIQHVNIIMLTNYNALLLNFGNLSAITSAKLGKCQKNYAKYA